MPFYDAPSSTYDHGLHYDDAPVSPPTHRRTMAKVKFHPSSLSDAATLQLANTICFPAFNFRSTTFSPLRTLITPSCFG